MSTNTPHLRLFFAALAAALFASTTPAYASYGWPLKPFHQQHPVRGYFGDPRLEDDGTRGTFHFGIDISGRNGTPVYATLDGIAEQNDLHSDVVEVSNGHGTTFEYWHILPAVRFGTPVYAYRTLLGYIEKPWGHVHFAERVNGAYVNPLRSGALEPYRDRTRPTIQAISLVGEGVSDGNRVSGTIDIVAAAFDTTPLEVAPPWNDKPVTPALVEWELTGGRGLTSSSWRVAADFRGALPTVSFDSVYARGTRPNFASTTARYRFYLARGLDTHGLPNGAYRIVVRVCDTRGNEATASRTFTVANG
jgi:hypothetical protein